MNRRPLLILMLFTTLMIVAGGIHAQSTETPAPAETPPPADGTPTDGTPTDGTPTDGTPTDGTPTSTDGMPASTDAVTNIMLVFDASGSMAESLGDAPKIDSARRAMEYVIASLPMDAPNLNVGFRIFGHEGDSSEAQRDLSCQSTALLVPPLGVNLEGLRTETNAWQPTGWAPISLALEEAAADLEALGEQQECLGMTEARNIIIMVIDNEETCDGDPCAAAQAIAASDAQTVIHVVGFGLMTDAGQNLNCITQNGGSFTDAQDADGLANALSDIIGSEVRALGYDFQPPTIEDFEVTPVAFATVEMTAEMTQESAGGEGTAAPETTPVASTTPESATPAATAAAMGDGTGTPAITETTEAGEMNDMDESDAMAQTPDAACPIPERFMMPAMP